MHVERKDEFMAYMEVNGPKGPASRSSYISYLESASKYSGIKISPGTCACQADINLILEKCQKKGVPPKTRSNFGSALHKYLQMASALQGVISAKAMTCYVKVLGTARIGEHETSLVEDPSRNHAITINSQSGEKIATLTIANDRLASEEFWVQFRRNVQIINI